ncbi:5-oxoprolinase (ATP-hydrolysing) [Catalinimonas alkaloidigena]|uniref:5-oxoprolinase (ATP-hydrolysing) n=1 Tax=Catalinimonas alkaloidigena TaxID=1075417 RepID=A0A1G9IVT4_9BACT|nr:hydantoinase B/oxoprolinase family protein [Catalinimonas alkaloidigena]SDL29165.1 5-oxoprolinase (ATP-hydrolysing) [Catalinimonas alkaloidigena]
MTDTSRWRIRIDTGGTFTDCLALTPDHRLRRAKVLSSSALRGQVVGRDGDRLQIRQRWATDEDIFAGYTFTLPEGTFSTTVRHVNLQEGWLELEALPDPLPSFPFDFALTAGEEAPILAARLVTGTPLSEPLPPLEMRLGSTRGTNALLERKGASVALVITKGFADLLAIGTQQRPDLFTLQVEKAPALYTQVFEVDERLQADGSVLRSLTPDEIERVVTAVQQSRAATVALALMHSYRNPAHEQQLAEALQAADIAWVSVSSALAPGIRILPRAETAVVNAYLTPVLNDYLQNIRAKLAESQLLVMTSAGGLVGDAFFRPKDSLLSGPAGGVVGAAWSAQRSGIDRILTLDMGGTSTDVARWAGVYDYRQELRVGDAHLLSPALAIETVAAGGGSICAYDGHRLQVGPESAGAQPGPACYGAGGPLTITDVNLLLGRLAPDYFGIPVNQDAAQRAFERLKTQLPSQTDDAALLQGLLDIANEKMADAIRHISVQKGYDPTEYTLLAFGGAGGQHACRVAERLGILQVLVPADAGLLSALGMGAAVVERFASRQVLRPLEEAKPDLPALTEALAAEARAQLHAEGYADELLEVKQVHAFLRFRGQDSSLEIVYDEPDTLETRFLQRYREVYGHVVERPIEVVNWQVQVATRPPAPEDLPSEMETYTPSPEGHRRHYTGGGWHEVPVYLREAMRPGAVCAGPALLIDRNSTTVVEAGWAARIDAAGNALLSVEHENTTADLVAAPEAVQRELFANRLTGVAEEMGALLQRTAFSVNVKERLDFSCALLDQDAQLVVNAPHIPVHLGSLGLCVRQVREALPLGEGDVIITNHPGYGGSHLPDITLIAAAHTPDGMLIGYVANRAHHAELGGSRPGSMPPDARSLSEEGVVIAPTYLVRGGEVQWDTLEKLFTTGSYPTRAWEENRADLNAALASIRLGVTALQQLAEQHGLSALQQAMRALQTHAAQVARRGWTRFAPGTYQAEESLDDGTPLRVHLDVSHEHLSMDFTGSGGVHPGNLNATPAIVRSVILYVLRLLCPEDVPLNEGMLQDVSVHLPEGCLNPPFPADPTQCPAVVGGNTEVSQRLVDTLLKAFGVAAASQGTMNNLLFGNARFGYYETLGGGVGATEGYAGASAVHQHMTNTRITDPEVLEQRYPVRLERFAVRRGSGGKGQWAGGDGLVREIRFLEPVQLTLLTQRRQTGPYGQAGGHAGQPGRQRVIRQDGTEEGLQGVDGRDLNAGDRVVIETPGGGGWGSATQPEPKA